MTDDEIVRRIRALLATPPEKRPFTVNRLERLAGLAKDHVPKIAKWGGMKPATARRLARALTLFENDQVVATRSFHRNKPDKITIRAPQPPIERRMGIVFTKHGPRIEKRVVNPNTFPDFK